MSGANAKRVRAAGQAVVTANLLRSGDVVWRRPDQTWSPRFHEAEALPADSVPEALTAARRDETACIVVGVYAAPLTGAAEPAGWKERIRAFGPTVAVSGGLHGQD